MLNKTIMDNISCIKLSTFILMKEYSQEEQRCAYICVLGASWGGGSQKKATTFPEGTWAKCTRLSTHQFHFKNLDRMY